ncbi:MAG: peroxiredoxin family protein [bacterium]
MTTIPRGAALLALVLAVLALPAQAAPVAAPAFSLELFDGKTLSLNQLKGTAVVLLFWAPW